MKPFISLMVPIRHLSNLPQIKRDGSKIGSKIGRILSDPASYMESLNKKKEENALKRRKYKNPTLNFLFNGITVINPDETALAQLPILEQERNFGLQFVYLAQYVLAGISGYFLISSDLFLVDMIASMTIICGAFTLPTLYFQHKQTRTISEVVLLPGDRIRVHRYTWFLRPLPALWKIEADVSDCQLNILGGESMIGGRRLMIPWKKMFFNDESIIDRYESREKYLFHRKYISRSTGLDGAHSSRDLFSKSRDQLQKLKDDDGEMMEKIDFGKDTVFEKEEAEHRKSADFF